MDRLEQAIKDLKREVDIAESRILADLENKFSELKASFDALVESLEGDEDAR